MTTDKTEDDEAANGICHDFLLKETEQIRSMFYDTIKEIGVVEKYAIVGTGGIWSWWLTKGNQTFMVLVVLLIFQVFLGARAYSIFTVMNKDREYLVKVEDKLNIPKDFGWGHDITIRPRWFRNITGFLFWPVLYVTQCIGMLYVYITTSKCT